MVSEDLPKESASAILRRCLVSSMDAGSVHAETFAYGLQFQPSSAPNYFEQICRPEDRGMALNSLIDREARKDSLHGNGHGLSLTLGSELPAHANAVNSSYSSNGNVVCDGEINSRVYNALNPSSQNFNSMATILTALRRSPYMKPAQQLLDEVVCVSNAVEPGSDEHLRRSVEVSMTEGRSPRHEGSRYSSEEKDAVHVRISKLVALLDQLETRYEQYFHQMDTVVSAFEAIAGVGAAASYTALTIQAMSKHFSNLRDAIINQLNAQKDSLSKDTSRNYGCASSRQKREALHHLGMIQIGRVWRPLRGLPEESVAHLRSWLFEHFLHPYPTDNEKLMLASQTGLTRNQISNWFINARVRLWKPMIEEMYREEFAEDMQD